MTVRVAAVQAEPVWFDLKGTTDKTIALMKEASREGAQLVAFPELWIPGYPYFLLTTTAAEEIPYVARYRAAAMSVDSPEMMAIRVAARDLGILVGFGFAERDTSTLYMSQCLVDEHGEIVLHRRKLKPTHVERILFGQGDGSDLEVVQTSAGRIGALNCAENFQPLSKYALIAQDEQIRISSWPVLDLFGGCMLHGDGIAAVNQANAMEGSEFVLMSSQVFGEKGVEAFGESAASAKDFRGGGYARIYGPDTSLLTEVIPPDQEGIVYADVDLGLIDIANHFFDPVGHYSRPDVFDVRINRNPQPAFRDIGGAETAKAAYPSLDEEIAANAQVGA